MNTKIFMPSCLCLVILILLSFLSGCASAPEEEDKTIGPVITEQTQTEEQTIKEEPVTEEPAEEPIKEPETQDNETKEVTTQDQQEPQEEPEETEEPQVKDFVVTEELYTETFSDIEALIVNLNKIVASKNFNLWRSYLTEEFISYYSDPEVLDEVSSQLTRLHGQKIIITDLNNYFNYVVVPSRSRVRLDEIDFIDDSNVKAFMISGNKKVLLYNLEKINNDWKIDLQQ